MSYELYTFTPATVRCDLAKGTRLTVELRAAINNAAANLGDQRVTRRVDIRRFSRRRWRIVASYEIKE